MTCSMCKASYLDTDAISHRGRFTVITVSTVWSEADEFGDNFCSIECLLEWAWKVKESQPKFSKSKVA